MEDIIREYTGKMSAIFAVLQEGLLYSDSIADQMGMIAAIGAEITAQAIKDTGV